MRFYHLSTLGVPSRELAIIDSAPRPGGKASARLATGDRAKPYYPLTASISLSEDKPGIQLSSLLGNTLSCLVVNSMLKQTIEEHCQGIEIEYFSFDLYDHRERLYSKDYWIINPIGTLDCLDVAATQAAMEALMDPWSESPYVLNSAKLNGAPSLFRLHGEPMEYVIDEKLATALKERAFTNVILHELAIRT